MAAFSLARFGFSLPKNDKKEDKHKKRKDSKDKYEVSKRVRRFVPSWTEQFPGIEDHEDGMICTVCTRYPSQANNLYVKGCSSYRIDSIRLHWQSPEHVHCLNAENVRQNGQGPLDVVMHRLGVKHRAVLLSMFNTAYTVMKHEMSFTTYPVLLRLQVKNGGNLSHLASYGTDKACARFSPYIADAIREPLRRELQQADVFSCMFDGATDCSICEVEVVYARYLDSRGYAKDVFIGLEDILHAHADGVFDAVGRALSKFMSDDWHQKLVGAGCDGASVNLGVRNSVATRLRDGHEHIVTVHCVAHRLELSVLNAVKEHRMLETVQDMLKKIHKHYHYSPKQLRDLAQVAEVFNENWIKPTRLQGTRWLPHMQKASKALITGYKAIYTHFDHVGQAGPNEATAEVRGRAVYMSQKLRDFRVLRFIFFMQDLLRIVATLSLKFQKDGSGCADFLDALETAALEIVELGQEPGEQLAAFLTEVQQGNGSYKGVQLTNYDQDNMPAYDFTNICTDVIDHLETRLENNNQNPSARIIKAGRIFDTREWPVTREELATYGNKDLTVLIDRFQPVLGRLGVDMALIRREWALMKANLGRPGIQGRQRPVVNDLFPQKRHGDDRFVNILRLIEIVLVLPMSSACCERGFSCLKRIKREWKASLATRQVNHLMCASLQGPELAQYEAEPALNMWWEGGQRQRRPRFAAAIDQEEDEEDDLLNYMLDHAHDVDDDAAQNNDNAAAQENDND